MGQQRFRPAVPQEARAKKLHHFGDTDILPTDLIERPVLRPLEYRLECFHQVEDRDREPRAFAFRNEPLDLRIRPDGVFYYALLLQHLGRILETLVLDELLDQL